MGCDEQKAPSERAMTIELLTDNSAKHWVVDKSNIDGQQITPSSCDSAYVLIMRSDFSWEEVYKKIQCSISSYGSWDLNDENNVVIIQYINRSTGFTEEKSFEIEELSEEYFAYQIAENNRLKYVRLRRD
jgi:hypothetical protein